MEKTARQRGKVHRTWAGGQGTVHWTWSSLLVQCFWSQTPLSPHCCPQVLNLTLRPRGAGRMQSWARGGMNSSCNTICHQVPSSVEASFKGHPRKEDSDMSRSDKEALPNPLPSHSLGKARPEVSVPRRYLPCKSLKRLETFFSHHYYTVVFSLSLIRVELNLARQN